MLSTLAIISFSTAAAGQLIQSHSPTAALRSARTVLINDLINEREFSLTTNANTSITFEDNQYFITGKNLTRTLSGNIKIDVSETAYSEVVFYEDGSSNGGSVTLSKKGYTEHVTVNEITGLIRAQ